MQLPNVGFDEIAAVKRLSHDGRAKLAAEINATDPARIFADVITPNESTRKIICPLCENGSGGDHTPVKVVWRSTFWHYKCYKCGELEDTLLKIIAHGKELTLSNFAEFCEALAIGAELCGITVANGYDDSQQKSQRRHSRPKVELQLADLPAQAPEYERLNEARLNLPKWFKSHGDIRGLRQETLARLMWGILFDFKHPNENDYAKFLALIIPNDGGGIFAREFNPCNKGKGLYRNINPTTTTTIVKPTADKILFVVEGAIDGASIAQATNFEYGVIAIGGTSGGEQLLARLNELFPEGSPRPKVVLMLDNDDTDPDKNSGQKAAAKLLPKIRQLGFAVVNRVICDETRRDANKILIDEGNDALKARIDKIVADSQAEFAAIGKELADKAADDDKLRAQLDEWQHANGAIDHSVMPELLDAVKFVDAVTPETLTAEAVQSQKLFHALALCQFYGLPARVAKIYGIITDAKNNAKEAATLAKSGLTAPVGDDIRMWANVTLSDIKRAVNKLITEYRKAHEKWRKTLELIRRRDEEQAKIDARQLAEEDTLTQEQIDYLFSFAENKDYENAERLRFLFGDRIRYIHLDDQWLAFHVDKGLWQFGSGTKNTVLMPFARKLAKLLSDNAPNPIDYPETKEVINYWKSSKCTSLAFNYLKSEESIYITWDDLDKHKNLLSFKNGVVDLKTGKFYPCVEVDPTWLITRQCNMVYVPGAVDETLNKFLESIQPDKGTQHALLCLIGYLFTGEISQQYLWLWKGNGGNGKSTLLNLLLHAGGTYAVKLPTSAILETTRPTDANAATAALNPIVGARICVYNELKPNEFLNVPLVKDLTGGDVLPLRPLHKEARNIHPVAKHIINGNFFPRVRNPKDFSINRRIRTLEFNQTFNEHTADPNLFDKLTTPQALSALATIIVSYAKTFYDTTSLPESGEMRQSRRGYIVDNDFISEFLAESCIVKQSAFVPAKKLYERLRLDFPKESAAYRDKDLKDLVLQNKCVRYDRHKNTRQQCFFGIGLTDERATSADYGEEIPADEAPPF